MMDNTNQPIVTGANTLSVKALREKERKEKEAVMKEKCEQRAIQLLGSQEELVKLSNANKGIWYLPLCDDDDNIEVMAIMKPIDRSLLSYASTKIETEGIWEFFHTILQACFVAGDKEIMTDDTYAIPACSQVQKIVDGKKAYLLKR